jgi:endonuclease/exonuclease/phosphatase (EEP) superfamily protein YafD
MTRRGRTGRRVAASLLLAASLAVACRTTGIVAQPTVAAAPPQAPAAFTLVTWNVRKGKHQRFRSDLLELVSETAPLLVLLQEARADLMDEPPLAGSFARGWHYPWPGGDTIGVLSLSWSMPLRLLSLHSRWREFLVTAPKVALASEHRLADGTSVLALNVHLLNFERWSTFKLRAQLEDLRAVMRDHVGPIVLAGDMNGWSQRRLALVEETMREVGLEEAGGFGEGRRTGDLGWSLLNWLFGVDPTLPLDRIYYRGLVPREVKVLPYTSSDHAALLVSFTLPDRNTAAGLRRGR